MASKHDAKRARENMWVTQQNLARAKGGRPLYESKQHIPEQATCAGALPPSVERRLAERIAKAEAARAPEETDAPK